MEIREGLGRVPSNCRRCLVFDCDSRVQTTDDNPEADAMVLANAREFNTKDDVKFTRGVFGDCFSSGREAVHDFSDLPEYSPRADEMGVHEWRILCRLGRPLVLDHGALFDSHYVPYDKTLALLEQHPDVINPFNGDSFS